MNGLLLQANSMCVAIEALENWGLTYFRTKGQVSSNLPYRCLDQIFKTFIVAKNPGLWLSAFHHVI